MSAEEFSPDTIGASLHCEISDMFVVGKSYYQFELVAVSGALEPRVTTWTYRGFIRKDYSSTSCEVPYHFYEFVRACVPKPTEYDVLLIPSHSQAKESMFTWNEFVDMVHSVSDDEDGNTPIT